MEVKVIVTKEEILSMPHDETLGKWVRKQYWKLLEDKIRDEDVEYDHCVICGKQSPYTRNTPIEDRVNYVDGAGQSCFTPHKCDKI
jgi:hypothetical protein